MSLGAVIIILLIVSGATFAAGLLVARKRSAKRISGKRIEEYSFYPFTKNEAGQVAFNVELFNKAVQHFLRHKEPLAAQQLIIIGEQNLVRDILASENLTNYKHFYKKYEGHSVISDNARYLENYKRIVQLIGKSFAGAGIEILLHNLVNPSKSIIAIENGEVTGRKIENGATNLVLDLKTRKLHNQDKLNYELNIGARKFKCTTIPIFRTDYGLVGAICINVDVHFLKDEVLSSHARMVAFIDQIVKTDFELDENILSKQEYKKALAGKRHFLDEVLIKEKRHPGRERQLLAILFSDIVGFSSIMGSNEQDALQILEYNRDLHKTAIETHRGELLKEMGDGMLVSFYSALDAVQCAEMLIRDTSAKGKYQLRIGVHLGEVISKGGDVFGDGVNIASRIQEEAEAGKICISADVYNNVRNKLNFDIEPMGEIDLKNIRQKVRLFQIGMGADVRNT